MTRRESLKRIAAGAAGAALALQRPLSRAAEVSTVKPNFIFILIDDMGWADLACYGSTFFETPHIDRLAAEGVRFTDGYAACPVCSPTRASVMTGKYPARLHLTNFLVGRRWPTNPPILPVKWQLHLPLEEVTLAEALKAAGYATCHVGKWHLNEGKVSQPDQQGFDLTVPKAPNDADKQAAGFTDAALRFIEDHKAKPFFLYLCHHSVHIPLEARKELVDKYAAKAKPGDAQNNPIYAAMVECVDKSVGRVMAKLADLGIADRTVVVFTSDNGGLSVKEGPNTPATSNAPLRAGKGHVYEGSIRVPLIVKWPGVTKPGSTCSVPVSSQDFYPTFLEIADVQGDPKHVVDGVSIVPLVRGAGGLKRDALYWHYPHYSNQGGRPGGAVRQGDWKLVEFYDTAAVELYNLKDDVGEKNDLSKQQPERAAELRKKLDDWRKAVGAQMPARNPAYDPARPSVPQEPPQPKAEPKAKVGGAAKQ
ncbi:MAG: sulfatase [Planctomycetes bacterium]|nr:sulfatase [Planctomycetota bacterium]